MCVRLGMNERLEMREAGDVGEGEEGCAAPGDVWSGEHQLGETGYRIDAAAHHVQASFTCKGIDGDVQKKAENGL